MRFFVGFFFLIIVDVLFFSDMLVAQKYYNQYELSDTIILRTLNDQLIQMAYSEDNKDEPLKLSQYIYHVSDCLHEQFPEDNQVYKAYYEGTQQFIRHQLHYKIEGLNTPAGRNKFKEEFIKRFGYYSNQMHYFYEYDAIPLKEAGNYKETMECYKKAYEIRKKYIPIVIRNIAEQIILPAYIAISIMIRP